MVVIRKGRVVSEYKLWRDDEKIQVRHISYDGIQLKTTIMNNGTEDKNA